MTFVKTPMFLRVVPYMDAPAYLREGGGSYNPRRRIEFIVALPPDFEIEALAYRKDCPSCGLSYNPIRRREGGGLYFACSCELDINISCSRRRAARQEADIVGQAVLAYHAGRGTKSLFP